MSCVKFFNLTRYFQYIVFKVQVQLKLLLFTANGDGEIRTLDPLLARQVLSQLSYTPTDAGLPFFQGNPYILFDGHLSSGLKWTRTTDLTLIRRAL